MDIDPAVVRAAQSAMGLAGRIAGLSLTVTSAEDFLSRSPEGTFDAVAVDLFDGADAVPRALTDAQSDLLRAVASAVHPERGLVVVNRHSGPRGGNGILGLGGQGAGYEVSSPAGAAVRATGEALLDAMGAGGEAGCFTVKALRHRQQNVCVACVRGGLATGAGLQDALTDGLARWVRRKAWVLR